MLTQRGENCLEEIIEIYGHPYSAYEIGTVAPDAEGFMYFQIRRDNLRELMNGPNDVHTFDATNVINHDFRGPKN